MSEQENVCVSVCVRSNVFGENPTNDYTIWFLVLHTNTDILV